MSDNAVLVAPQMICNAMSTALDDVIAVVDTRHVGRLADIFVAIGILPRGGAFLDPDPVTARTIGNRSEEVWTWQL
jgi:hypothetical protein